MSLKNDLFDFALRLNKASQVVQSAQDSESVDDNKPKPKKNKSTSPTLTKSGRKARTYSLKYLSGQPQTLAVEIGP